MVDDTLTLTVRLHDPKEKLDSKKSAQWVTAKVARPDLALSLEDFSAKYFRPAFQQILQAKNS